MVFFLKKKNKIMKGIFIIERNINIDIISSLHRNIIAMKW
jgi:hypothetical protein